jgi:hypothetical protein
MSHESKRDETLRRLVDHALRDLPHRPAPATLEARVEAALRRRAAEPWWRRSFAHWPTPARSAFVAVCITLTALTLLGGSVPTLDVAPAEQHLTGLLSLATALAGIPARLVPPLWLDSLLAAGALLYAMLFGLGALAYRTLFLKPLDGR